ncbi:(3S,6E)-nerolidol synthase 2, chloroplastic/mitochondrial-like isoform X2 [Dioscorea cayenensis subsp. rotundata]|uniref:(3S,6E)-nerolidol synthase 2, chloroplastic/mitochondrial-like isoform X2 n=1 Tax=Dioscorea cayennensis subsp. rotundata TaxID=55577 RepID=A0AB40C2X2_DIOCR|nr:(3S,6E)-nerolidol synthase 2, chloroplastic/mitochondrial-like isoform X2 [Dioscorea cayenensis subsp. rotundata]
MVRDMLFSKEGNKTPLQSMVLIDTLQYMGLDHLFKEEIGSTLSSIYDNFTHQRDHGRHNLFESSLFFRLFREHGYSVSPKMLKKFIDKNGEFKLASSKDIKGLMSLYEASHLNIGEDILRKGKEFSSKHLWDSIEWLDNKHANQVKETLEHPYHMSIQRYKARRYISMHQDDERGCKDVVFELAKSEFNAVQLLHQRELNAILRWDISAINNLPNYMKVCFNALYNVTNEIAEITLKEYGWNPINTLSKSWGKLCNAFLQEAKWFASKQIPNKDEYLRNAVTSSGVFIVIVHLFFLMGQGLTFENIQHIENDPSFVSKSGTILRLWDDLGSAKDENQKGFDGSYMELYMKENQECTAKEAQEHVMLMISGTWDALNKESFTQSSFPQPLINATLNLARMVRVMYSYNDDNHHLPMLDDYIFSLLHHPL